MVRGMKLVTLQRHAPVTPGATHCRLCDGSIEGSVQDRVLVGPPGVPQLDLTICLVCGQAIQRLIDVAGAELSVVVQGGAPGVEQRVRGPMATVPERSAIEATLDDARRELANEAENLARTEQKLRTEAERLGAVRPPSP